MGVFVSSWRKSSFSTSQAACVEVLGTLNRVRDSKNLAGPDLPAPGFAQLVATVRAGRLQRPAP